MSAQGAWSAARVEAIPALHGLTVVQANALLREKLGPWLQEMALVVETIHAEGARLRMPHSPRLSRPGGSVSGQALLAAADSAMAIAIFATHGGFRNATTVGQSMSFMRPIGAVATCIEASVRKLGRSLVFCEATFRAEGSAALCAHATATWALIP
jgi:uncharacterized protein (TIGR00369 family)